jgi:multidrug/hemolysin transport system permease protein
MLAKRMLLLFFRDKMNVFFSLLATFIIILLYVLFLGNLIENDLERTLGFWSEQIRLTTASIMLAGMVAVTSTSACMGALGVAVTDKEGSGMDFYTSPVPRWKISFGYITGAGTIGLIMTTLALVLVHMYLIALGGSLPSFDALWRLALTVVLGSLCANAMMYLVVMFIKTENAYSGFTTVASTLMGFVMGIYIPIGIFPEGVQWVARLFPMSHAAAMFRQVIADGELAYMFSDAPQAYLENLRLVYGVVYDFGGFVTGFWFSALMLAGYTVVFFSASVLVMRNRKRV